MRPVFALVSFFIAALVACATPGPTHEVVAFQAAPIALVRDQATAVYAVPSTPAFQFTCGTTALRITPPSSAANYREITVWNAACVAGTCTTSATPVFLGGRYDGDGRTAAVTNATGMPICNDSAACIGAFATYTVPNLECIAGAETVVTVQVLQ